MCQNGIKLGSCQIYQFQESHTVHDEIRYIVGHRREHHAGRLATRHFRSHIFNVMLHPTRVCICDVDTDSHEGDNTYSLLQRFDIQHYTCYLPGTNKVCDHPSYPWVLCASYLLFPSFPKVRYSVWLYGNGEF